MKKLGIIIIAALLAVYAYPQEEQNVDRKTARKLEREQRKLQKELITQSTSRLVDSLINNRNFIIEAQYIGDQTGQRVVVDEKINFIIVDSSKIVIQYGSMGALLGYNGLGGITTDGNITKFEVKRTGRDKESYSIQLSAMTSVGMYDIFILISPDGNSTATIGGLSRGKLVYYGNVIPIKGARIFKGSVI